MNDSPIAMSTNRALRSAMWVPDSSHSLTRAASRPGTRKPIAAERYSIPRATSQNARRSSIGTRAPTIQKIPDAEVHTSTRKKSRYICRSCLAVADTMNRVRTIWSDT